MALGTDSSSQRGATTRVTLAIVAWPGKVAEDKIGVKSARGGRSNTTAGRSGLPRASPLADGPRDFYAALGRILEPSPSAKRTVGTLLETFQASRSERPNP
jgi:hypothetical protein